MEVKGLKRFHTFTSASSSRLSLADNLTGIPYKGRKITKKERPIWQIPYGAIVPQKTPNLLVAGRCFGFDEGLTWDAREIATCFVTGQAAGDAAALTVTRSNKAQDMDIAALQEILKKQNTLLEI